MLKADLKRMPQHLLFCRISIYLISKYIQIWQNRGDTAMKITKIFIVLFFGCLSLNAMEQQQEDSVEHLDKKSKTDQIIQYFQPSTLKEICGVSSVDQSLQKDNHSHLPEELKYYIEFLEKINSAYDRLGNIVKKIEKKGKYEQLLIQEFEYLFGQFKNQHAHFDIFMKAFDELCLDDFEIIKSIYYTETASAIPCKVLEIIYWLLTEIFEPVSTITKEDEYESIFSKEYVLIELLNSATAKQFISIPILLFLNPQLIDRQALALAFENAFSTHPRKYLKQLHDLFNITTEELEALINEGILLTTFSGNQQGGPRYIIKLIKHHALDLKKILQKTYPHSELDLPDEILLHHCIRFAELDNVKLLIENGASITAIEDEIAKFTITTSSIRENGPEAMKRAQCIRMLIFLTWQKQLDMATNM